MSDEHRVSLVGDVRYSDLVKLLARYGIALVLQDDAATIKASYWGDSEAGVAGRTVYVRLDTPVHSLLHEACHIVCMDESRRAALDRDAGGDDLEEAAVCYLQILLADHVRGVGRQRLMQDMDAWGYSFRLGNTRAWFETDAGDARSWLVATGLLGADDLPVFCLRS